MASDQLKIYNKYLLNQMRDVVSLSTDTLKVALLGEYSNAADISLEYFSELTDELPAVNGYTLGGQALSNVEITETAGVVKVASNDFVLLAIEGALSARYAVVYSATSTGQCLIGSILLDNTPTNFVAEEGQTLVIHWPPQGILFHNANNT
jgi:hypothetical protein